MSEYSFPTLTLKVLSDSRLATNIGSSPLNPISYSFWIIPLLQDISYAFLMSKNTADTDDLYSNALCISCSSLVRLSYVLLFFLKPDWYGHIILYFSSTYSNLLLTSLSII